MRNNKVVLPLTIILLLFFLPCSIYGIYKKITYIAPEDNPNHIHLYEGSLYYYDTNNKLLGSYKCKSNNCNDAITEIDDEYLNYKDYKNNKTSIYGNYVFINDDNIIYLYNLELNNTISEFKLIKI